MTLAGALRDKSLDSRRIRRLLYAAEGMMLAGILYLSVLIVVNLVSGLMSDVSLVTVIFATGFAISAGSLLFVRFWAIIQLELPSFYAGWKEIRRWDWLVGIAIPLAILLLGLSSVLWGLEWVSRYHMNSLISYGFIGCGLALRILVRNVADSDS